MEVSIVQFPETPVAVVEHRGSPALEHESVLKMIAWRKENRLPPEHHRSYGIHYNNPQEVNQSDYRVDLGTNYEGEVSENSYGVVAKLIPACRCALARHLGSRANVTAAAYLYECWLPNSGETLGEFPIFFHYVNVGPEVKEADMITDVYLPLADTE